MSTSIPYRVRVCFTDGCHIFEDYTIKDEKLCKVGKRLHTYDPTKHTELPGALAKVQPGKAEALLCFARRYGDLGYGNLEEGCLGCFEEPLPWIWGHISTVKLCLQLQQYVHQPQPAWVINDCLDKYRSQQGSQDTHTDELPIPVMCHTEVMRLTRKQHDSIHDFAQKIRHEIIQRNTKELIYRSRSVDGTTSPVLEYASLIEVVYWHLAEMERQPVKQCAGCGSLFIVQHGRQQYCPHPKPGKDSPCGANARQKKRRQTKRVSPS